MYARRIRVGDQKSPTPRRNGRILSQGKVVSSSEDYLDESPDREGQVSIGSSVPAAAPDFTQLMSWADTKESIYGFGNQSVQQLLDVYECFDLLEKVWPSPDTDDAASDHADANSFQRIPQQIGPYHLVEKIAEGGMGTVYKARQHEPIDRVIAIKLIRPGLESRYVISRFQAERQTLAMLEHPNIATILDAGTTENGFPFFVMEYVDGIPLTKYCDENQLTIRERLELFESVCHAIQHAHQKGIIHRDLKPSNILVGTYDGKPVPKVIDFGLAKAIRTGQQLNDRTAFTEFGQIVGTLRYMSPEQADTQNSDIDTRTDVYSMGVMLYELLTGTTPLQSSTYRQLGVLSGLELVRHKEPPRPSSRFDELAGEQEVVSRRRKVQPAKFRQLLKGELDWIVMKSLEKDRSRRYATTAAFADDISRFLNDEPVIARPQSTAYKVTKFVRKHRGLTASVLTIATMLVAAVLISNWYRGEANQARKIAENRTVMAVNAKSNVERQKRKAEANLARTNFFMAFARWDSNRALEARGFLEKIPEEQRGIEWMISQRHFRGSDLTCLGHLRRVTAVAFHPDGKSVISGSLDGTIKQWDSTTGAEIRSIAAHEKVIHDVCFNKDGSKIASASADKKIKVWDVESGNEILTLDGHQDSVLCVRFSPDGSRIASGGKDKLAFIWQLENPTRQTLKLQGHRNEVRSIAFSPDGSSLVSGGGNPHSNDSQGFLKLWDVKSGDELRTFNETPETILALDFSPDGKQLVSAGGHPTTIASSTDQIKLWDVETGEHLKSFQAHTGFVSSIKFSPDATRLASGAWDKKIVVWDIATGNTIHTLDGCGTNVQSVSWNPDGSRLASGGGGAAAGEFNGSVRIWDAVTGEESRTFRKKHGQIHSLDFHESNSQLLLAREFDAVLWDFENDKIIQSFEGHTKDVKVAKFSPDGSRIATGSFDQSVRIWDTKTGKQIHLLQGHTELVLSLTFSPDGSRLVTSSGEYPNPGFIKIWDLNSGKEIHSIAAHPSNINGVCFHPDGTEFASASEDRSIKIWDANTFELLHTLEGHTSFVHCLAYSQRGERIASGGGGVIKIWDSGNGEELRSLHGHTHYVTSVRFSPVDSRLISGSYDRSVRLWDINSGEELLKLNPHQAIIAEVGFSNDGQRIASVSHDGTAKIWGLERGVEWRLLNGHNDPVKSIGFSRDGTQLVTQSKNETLHWDLKSGQQLDDELSDLSLIHI